MRLMWQYPRGNATLSYLHGTFYIQLSRWAIKAESLAGSESNARIFHNPLTSGNHTPPSSAPDTASLRRVHADFGNALSSIYFSL